jgi:hypothetical protein
MNRSAWTNLHYAMRWSSRLDIAIPSFPAIDETQVGT